MLYYIIFLFPITLYGFFFQSSPCSCPQSSCPVATPCPESLLPTTYINPPSPSSFQQPISNSPCPQMNENNECGNILQTYQEPYTVTSSYSPTLTYGYQEAPQYQQVYVQPSQDKGNDYNSYQIEPSYSTQDIISPIDNNYNSILQPQRDLSNKEKFFADKTEVDTTSKTKNKVSKRKKSFKSLCNNSKLAKIMAEAIVPDLSVSKLLISDAVAIAYNNAKANVICASGDFSYSVLVQNEYCETTKGEVTCFAYL
uniref:Ground-like domain-containing protein n=1 Tax=Strongyloides stercoralis TaxID=6248 RepID=A0A0K0EQK2_STRER